MFLCWLLQIHKYTNTQMYAVACALRIAESRGSGLKTQVARPDPVSAFPCYVKLLLNSNVLFCEGKYGNA